MKNTSISLSDFEFIFAGYGHYKVIYRSIVTGRKYDNVTNNMPLIDATKNVESPKMKDLKELKRLCKL